MDLSTTWMGLRLPHPLIVGSSPLTDDLATVRRLEDAGAAALVLRSLFEEQLVMEQITTIALADNREEAYSQAVGYFQGMTGFKLDPDDYLELLRKVTQAVDIPVVASLNGTSPGGWLRFAGLLHEAGAAALELNVYHVATDPDESAETIEKRSGDMLRSIKSCVPIPVAVKLSPYYTALAHFARELDRAGADGLVLFNRFIQPDIDVEEGSVEPRLRLSDPHELLLRLRWLAILHGRVDCPLAVSGGVHGVLDVVKSLLAGAQAVQLVSVLMREGPGRLDSLRRELADWLEEHEVDTLQQLCGRLSLKNCPDARAYERANYLGMLQDGGD